MALFTKAREMTVFEGSCSSESHLMKFVLISLIKNTMHFGKM